MSASTLSTTITLYTCAMPDQDQDHRSTTSSIPVARTSIPPGFTYLRGPDNREYLVPDFYAGETMFAWEHKETMEILEVESASRVVSLHVI